MVGNRARSTSVENAHKRISIIERRTALSTRWNGIKTFDFRLDDVFTKWGKWPHVRRNYTQTNTRLNNSILIDLDVVCFSSRKRKKKKYTTTDRMKSTCNTSECFSSHGEYKLQVDEVNLSSAVWMHLVDTVSSDCVAAAASSKGNLINWIGSRCYWNCTVTRRVVTKSSVQGKRLFHVHFANLGKIIIPLH